MRNFFSSIFKKKQAPPTDFFIFTDVHSHLLPAIDDGSKSLEETEWLIQKFQQLGYRKLITTPHIMSDFYKNTPEIIQSKLQELQNYLKTKQIDITLEAAAEYYLDDVFVRKLEQSEPLLTFGSKYLLFETSFDNQPSQLNEVIFLLQSQDYKPVLAHPERYTYLYHQFELVERFFERGVILQINLNSLCGYYGKHAKEFAEKLINREMVGLVGSDCHSERHIDALRLTQSQKYYQKLASLNLLNNSL